MRLRRLTFVLALLALAAGAHAQLSLSSAVNLALQNSPKVRMAQADVARARAALQENRDVFIPTSGISGGIGRSTGPPLAVPQVFTVSAQSLIFNFSVRDSLRSAHASLAASELSLQDARSAVVEDVVTTYLALDNAVQRHAAATEAQTIAGRLGEIEQGRFDAGVDAHIEVTRARRTGLQMQRQAFNTEDDIAASSEHLSNVVGIRLTGADVVHSSIPASFSGAENTGTAGTMSFPESPSIQSAEQSALSKAYAARALQRYLFRPQFSFGASYSYINTAFTNYNDYYNLFTRSTDNNPNAISVGVQLQIPFVDYGHRARARAAAAEALRARYEVQDARNQLSESNNKALRANRQLTLTADLARADRDLAQDELDTVLLQLQAGAAGASTGANGTMLSPKDEQNARLQVQQRTLDLLTAELQLQQTEVTLMRQEGTLSDWVRSASTGLPSPSVTAAPVPAAHP